GQTRTDSGDGVRTPGLHEGAGPGFANVLVGSRQERAAAEGIGTVGSSGRTERERTGRVHPAALCERAVAAVPDVFLIANVEHAAAAERISAGRAGVLRDVHV